VGEWVSGWVWTDGRMADCCCSHSLTGSARSVTTQRPSQCHHSPPTNNQSNDSPLTADFRRPHHVRVTVCLFEWYAVRCMLLYAVCMLCVCLFVRSFVRSSVRSGVRSFVRSGVRSCVRAFVLAFVLACVCCEVLLSLLVRLFVCCCRGCEVGGGGLEVHVLLSRV